MCDRDARRNTAGGHLVLVGAGWRVAEVAGGDAVAAASSGGKQGDGREEGPDDWTYTSPGVVARGARLPGKNQGWEEQAEYVSPKLRGRFPGGVDREAIDVTVVRVATAFCTAPESSRLDGCSEQEAYWAGAMEAQFRVTVPVKPFSGVSVRL